MTIIRTTRLVLRPIERGDAPRFAVLCNDETLARNTSRLPFPYTLDDAISFVEMAMREHDDGMEHRFAVCRDGEIIACTGLRHRGPEVFELGYWVGADARGGGVATEAAAAIIEYGFRTVGAASIIAGYFMDNPASARVLEKLGFKHTGETKPIFSRARGEEAETAQLALKPDEFVGAADVSITI